MQTSNLSWRKLLLLDMNLLIHFPELPKQISWDRLGEGWRYCRHIIIISLYTTFFMLYTSVSHLWISMRNDRKYSNMWRWNWSNIPKIIYPKMLETTDAFWFWQFGCPNLLDPTSLVALLHLSLRWQSLLLIVLASWVARTPTAAGASLQHMWSNQIRESSFDGGAFLLRVCICCYAWAEFDVLTNGTVDWREVSKTFCNHLGSSQKWMDWPKLVYEFYEWNMAGKC